MPDYRFFEVPAVMKNEPCAVCGKPDCDVLVQENTFGGANAVFHESCLDDVLKPEDESNEETS